MVCDIWSSLDIGKMPKTQNLVIFAISRGNKMQLPKNI